MPDLILHERPILHEPRMILGFTGWMDGGRVSTGTIGLLSQALSARKFAEIDSLEFYIHNLPAATLPITIVADGESAVLSSVSPMEQAAVFRPHTEIVDGVVRDLSFERNEFLCAEQADVILFSGEEPHIRWRSYADCLLGLAEQFSTREMLFVGSVAGPIPHTREPRIHSCVSSEALKNTRQRPDVGFTDYEGPASFITFLLQLAASRGIEMRTLVVEIPHYPFLSIPTYPASILRVASVLADWLELELPFSELRPAAERIRQQLDELMDENDDFRDLVDRLEEAYDAEEASVDEHVLRRLIDQIDLGGEGHGS